MAHSQWGLLTAVCVHCQPSHPAHSCTHSHESSWPLARISGLEHTPTTGVHTRCVAPLWREGYKEETHRGHAKAIWARIHESQILRASRKGDVNSERAPPVDPTDASTFASEDSSAHGVEHSCRMDRTRPSEVQSSE